MDVGEIYWWFNSFHFSFYGSRDFDRPLTRKALPASESARFQLTRLSMHKW